MSTGCPHISGPIEENSVNIDPDGKLLRKSLEIGMTREEAEEWLRYVEAAGDVGVVHIARAMPLAFLMRQAQAIGCDPTEYRRLHSIQRNRRHYRGTTAVSRDNALIA
jgi:hypothetical protein